MAGEESESESNSMTNSILSLDSFSEIDKSVPKKKIAKYAEIEKIIEKSPKTPNSIQEEKGS